MDFFAMLWQFIIAEPTFFILSILIGLLILIGIFRREMVDEILLVIGLIVLTLMIKFKGIEWAFENLGMFFIAITVFAFLESKIKKWGRKE
jgi:hypothetical protein